LFQSGKGQAFTLEGIVAAVMMLMVTYFLFHSTIVISPLTGENSDAQLRQLGLDALTILDNPDSNSNDTLQNALANLNDTNYPHGLINSIERILPDNVDYNLEVLYYNTSSKEIQTYSITNKVYTADTVSVSRYIVLRNGVIVDDSPFKFNESGGVEGTIDSEYPVVLEVRLLLWRT
jgi:hypothetical protein